MLQQSTIRGSQISFGKTPGGEVRAQPDGDGLTFMANGFKPFSEVQMWIEDESGNRIDAAPSLLQADVSGNAQLESEPGKLGPGSYRVVARGFSMGRASVAKDDFFVAG